MDKGIENFVAHFFFVTILSGNIGERKNKQSRNLREHMCSVYTSQKLDLSSTRLNCNRARLSHIC